MRRAGEEIEELMSNDKLREAWGKTKRWYQESKVHRVPPTSEQLEQTATLQEDFYTQRPTEGESIPILVQPVSIADGPPGVREIAAAVRKIRSDRARGPSGMKAEHLKAWLHAANREKEPDIETWDKVVSIIQVAFWEGYIPEALIWTTMVLITMRSG